MRFTGLSEFLVYGLLFAAIVGFNIFKQVLAARREQQRRREHAAKQPPTIGVEPALPREPARAPPELLESDWGRPTDAGPPVVVVPAPERRAPAALAQEREQRRQERAVATRQAMPAALPCGVGRRRLLRTRQDLRHGVILMTVLGPCRALQPYDQDHG